MKEHESMIHIVLDRPKIAGNIGSIVRLAVNLNASVHICGETPFGREHNKAMWRSGLDYWAHARVHFHESLSDCVRLLNKTPCIIEVNGKKTVYDYTSQQGDVFVFGPEDGSVEDAFVEAWGLEHVYQLPHRPEARCLNLAQCVAVVAYESWRQICHKELG
jgi:tRNA (cytidine/uridine-2'-O-)-methyltransferase